MAFKNLPPDLTLPPDGSLTPGSGTVYIGGPQLPAAMSQFESAIIFFTDTLGLAQGIDFWYLAHFGQTNPPFTSDGVQIGYYPTGGPLTKSTIGTFISSITGRDDVVIEAHTGDVQLRTTDGTGSVFLQSGGQVQATAQQAVIVSSGGSGAGQLQLSALNGQVAFLCADFGNISFRKAIGTNTEIVEMRNLGTKPNIKALNSSTIDVWQSLASTQTIAGVAGCTVKFDWRITVDWVCEIRVRIDNGAGWPAVPAAGSVVCPTVAQGFPVIDVNSTGQGPHLVGIYLQSGTGNQGALGIRIDPGTPATLFFFGLPTSCVVMEASGTFTLAKP